MPEARHFKVTQTREVLVTANTAVDAARIAEAAFTHGQDTTGGVAYGKAPQGVWGNTNRKIREIRVEVQEE